MTTRQPFEREATAKTRPDRGECPVCGREFKLTDAERLPRHAAFVPHYRDASGLYCRGGKGEPAAEARQGGEQP